MNKLIDLDIIGIQGVTGPGPVRDESCDLVPIKIVESGERIEYKCPRTGRMHCPFGPALLIYNDKDRKWDPSEWYINGILLRSCRFMRSCRFKRNYYHKEESKDILNTMFYILNNQEEAPLYMYHPLLSYPAR